MALRRMRNNRCMRCIYRPSPLTHSRRMIKRRRPEPGRTAIPMSAELIKRLDDYRWRERIPSRAAAIRQILDDWLKRYERHLAASRPAKPPNELERVTALKTQ